MKNPFLNDPFAMVWQAFQNLYRDKNCDVYWDPNLQPDEAGKSVYGVTVFNDDGKVLVFVDAMISVNNAVEILAHELAHVVAGFEEGKDDHGPAWETAFESIKQEYGRIGDALFGKEEP